MKTGAAALALQVFFTNCLLANTTERSFYEERARHVAKSSLLASLPASLPLIQATASAAPMSLRTPALPGLPDLDASLGNVRSITANPSSDQSIVYIQDVHGNDEAQRHIAGAVTALIDGNKADVLVLEGASGNIDLRPFRNSPWPESARRAADGLLADHRISGAVFGAINAAHAVPVVGAEQAVLYERNVDAVRRAQEQTPAVRQALAERLADLSAQKERIYSPALLAFDHLVDGHRAGNVPMGRYAEAVVVGQGPVSPDLAAFLEAVRLEENLDVKAAERERSTILSRLAPKLTEPDIRALMESGLEYRAGRIRAADFYRRLSETCRRAGVALTDFPAMNRFVQYVLLADTIDMDRVSGELDRLERDRFDRLAATDGERSLIARSATLALQRGLCEFSLNSEEWQRYRPLSGREPMLEPFETFYRSAELRNEAIARNVLAAMRAHGPHAILVTGGFHSKDVARAIAGRASVANFVPRLTAVDAEGTSEALSVFTREKTPLDRLLNGDRLFLAPPPAPLEARAAVVPMTAADALHAGKTTADQAARFASTHSGWTVTEMTNLDEHVDLAMIRGGMAASMSVPFDDAGRPRYPALKNLTNRYQSFAMNSTFIMAPLLTLLTIAVFSIGGVSFSGYHIAAIYALSKAFLFWSVGLHEMAHLAADGQLSSRQGNFFRLLFNAFLHRSDINRMSTIEVFNAIGRQFILGTDITNAHVTARATRPEDVKRVAAAGRQTNLGLMFAGAGILALGATAMASAAPFFAAPLALGGFLLMVANATLVFLNRWSTDREAERTGIAPRIYQAVSGSLPADQNEPPVLDEEVIHGDVTTRPMDLNGQAIQPFLDNLGTQLDELKPDNYDAAVYPVLLRLAMAVFKNGPGQIHLRARIENGELVISVDFEKGGLLASQTAALADEFKDWQDHNWRIGFAATAEGETRSATIRAPLNVPMSLDDFPIDGPELLTYVAGLTPRRAGEVVATITQGMRNTRGNVAAALGIRRLISLLWINDAEIFTRAVDALNQLHEPDEIAAVTAELSRIAASDQPLQVRRRAEWAAAMLPGLAKSGESAWNYRDLAQVRLSGRAGIRVQIVNPGVLDLVVEEPSGLIGRLLRRLGFTRYPRRILATIRITSPGVQGALEGDEDREWLQVARISFPGVMPPLAVFQETIQAWAAITAPLGAVAEVEADAVAALTEEAHGVRWRAVLGNAGFRQPTVRPGGSHKFRKGTPAVTPTKTDTSVDSPLNIVRYVLWPLGVVTLFHFNWRDEVFHRVGAWIEGLMDNSAASLIEIHLGLAKPTSSAMRPLTDEMYRAHPWKRNFRIIAAPLGWLVTFTIIGTLLALNQFGVLSPNVWVLRWFYVELFVSGLALFLNIVRTPHPGYPGSDFWRYMTERKKPLRFKEKLTRPPTIEELRARVRKDHSPFMDLTSAAWDLIRFIVDRLRAKQLAERGITDLLNNMRAELTASGTLSTRTRAALRLRGDYLIDRYLRNANLETASEFQEETWSLLWEPLRDAENPLVGTEPRDDQGNRIPDEALRPLFTDAGWAAFVTYRAGDDRAVRGGLVRQAALGRLQLSLAAIAPDQIDNFFALTGKPAAAAVARRLISEGRAQDVAILDSAAIPWSPLEDTRRFGSVEEEIGGMSARARLVYLRRLMSADAPLIAAATLMNRTGKISSSERGALLEAIYRALEGRHSPIAFNYGAERDALVNTLRRALALRTTEDEEVYSPFFGTGFSPALSPAQTTGRNTTPSQSTRLRDGLEPLLGGSGSGGSSPRNLARSLSNLRPSDNGSRVPTSSLISFAVDPLQELVVRGGNPENAAALRALRRGPSSLTAGVKPDVVPLGTFPINTAIGQPVPLTNGQTANNNRPGILPVNQPLVTPNVLDRKTPGAEQTNANATANTTAVGTPETTASNAEAVTGARPTIPTNIFSAEQQLTRPVADNGQGPAVLTPAGLQEQPRLNQANEIDAAGATAANTGQAGTSIRPTGVVVSESEGAAERAIRRNETNAQDNLNATLQPGSPLAALFRALSARGFDVAALALGLTTALAAIMLGIHALGLPQIWLPATALAVTATAALIMTATLRGTASETTAFEPEAEPAVATGESPIAFRNRGAANERSRQTSATGRFTAALSTLADRVVRALGSATPGFFALPSSRAASALELRIVRSAALATLDAAAALLAERRGISPSQAVSVLADDQLTDDERAVVADLARATRDAARSAIARTLASRSAEDRAALTNSDLDQDSSNVRPTLVELRRVALVYRERERPETSPVNTTAEDRGAQLAGSVARGRALLVLERAWAEDVVDPSAEKPRAVRVIQIQSGRVPSVRSTAPETAGKTRLADDGSLENTDLQGLHETAGRPRGQTLSVQLGFGADPVLANAFRAPLTSPENRQIIAALGIAAGDNASSLALGESPEANGRKAAESSVRSDLSGQSVEPESRTPALDAALENAGLTGREPASALVDRILSGLRKPASIAATVALVALAGAAVAFGVVEAVVAALTVAVMFLVALGAQIAKMQRSDRGQAESPATSNPTTTGGDLTGAARASDADINRLADLISSFITGRARLGTAPDAASFAALLPTVESLGVGNQRVASEATGLSDRDVERLATLVSNRISRANADRRPTNDEALTWIKSLLSAGGRQAPLKALAGDKDMYYPVRERTNPGDMKAEMDGIENIRLSLSSDRVLYLSYESDKDSVKDALRVRFARDIASGRVQLIPRSAGLFEERNGRMVIRLATLAADLAAALGEKKAGNLLVLIPDHVGWDDTGLDRRSILDEVGFVLLQDFVTGIRVDRAALRNIGHLAEMISTQA